MTEDSDRDEILKGGMNLSISNFGPISKGAIRIKPLTILMGPNNSGKSYAATLIYSLIAAYGISRHRRMHPTQGRLPKQAYSNILRQDVEKMMRTKDEFVVPATRAVRKRLVDSVFAPILKTVIEGSFGSPASGLIRSGQRTSTITMTCSDIYRIKIADELQVSPQFNDATVHKVKISREPAGVRERSEGGARVLRMDERVREAPSRILASVMCDFLLGSLKMTPEFAHYLPAARSGILQGHRALAASFVQHAPYAGIDRLEIPRLTQVVSDFIYGLIELPDNPGPFAGLSKRLERELIGGSVGRSQSSKHMVPDIVYKMPQVNVPLHRSSSTVSEMAPLSLYLRHIVQKGDLLIIEEPEAHLHTSNQIVFAKYIARMIRSGINLLITTHSSVLMEELNNHLIAGSMDPESRIGAGIDKNDYLLPEEVSPYLFSRDGKGGHAIAPVEMDADGISLQEFIKITEPVYERGIKIDRWREQNGR